MPKSIIHQLLLAAVCCLSLISCSGGGGSSGSSSLSEPSPPVDTNRVLTGNLVPVIQGIAFSTPTLTGITDTLGHFSYRADETVRFSLGDTVLGVVDAESEISIFKLAETAEITGTQNIVAMLESKLPRGQGYHIGLPARSWLPFHGAMNRLYFLHSLDRDQDPANGVQIDPAVAELLQQITLSFNRYWVDFKEDLLLRKVRLKGQEMGAFEAELTPVSYADIMDEAYRAIGVSPEIYNIIRQYSPAIYSIDYTDDENGRLISRKGWADAEYQYDTHGNTIWYKDDCGIVTTGSFDVMGNLLQRESPYLLTSFEYDSYGGLISRKKDVQKDGNINESTIVERDDQGRSVRIEELRNGELISLELTTRDEQGNNIRSEYFDSSNISTPEKIELRTYDARNQLTRLEIRASTGSVNSLQSWNYDEEGYVVNSAVVRYSDGEPSSRIRQTYNRRWDILSTEFDHDGNNSVDSIISRSYNDKGHQTERIEDNNADGVPDIITTWEYDLGGNVTVTKVHENADGIAESITQSDERYEYDTRGNVILFEVDNEKDGVLDWLSVYEYDAGSNLIKEDNQIGIYELITRFEYRKMGWVGAFYNRQRVGEFDIFDDYFCP